MFDKTIIQQGSARHYHEHIEKRAPSDESVKLLREMESSLKQDIIKSLPLPDNTLAGTIMVYQSNLLKGTTEVDLVFKLNGNTHRLTIVLDDLRHHTTESRIAQIKDQLSEYITNNILKGLSESCQNSYAIKSILQL